MQDNALLRASASTQALLPSPSLEAAKNFTGFSVFSVPSFFDGPCSRVPGYLVMGTDRRAIGRLFSRAETQCNH